MRVNLYSHSFTVPPKQFTTRTVNRSHRHEWLILPYAHTTYKFQSQMRCRKYTCIDKYKSSSRRRYELEVIDLCWRTILTQVSSPLMLKCRRHFVLDDTCACADKAHFSRYSNNYLYPVNNYEYQ